MAIKKSIQTFTAKIDGTEIELVPVKETYIDSKNALVLVTEAGDKIAGYLIRIPEKDEDA